MPVAAVQLQIQMLPDRVRCNLFRSYISVHLHMDLQLQLVAY